MTHYNDGIVATVLQIEISHLQEPTQDRCHAELIIKITGHGPHVGPNQLVVGRLDVEDAVADPTDYIREDVLTTKNFLEHRKGHAAKRAVLLHRRNIKETLRRGRVEWPEQNGIHQPEHADIRADTESQRQDCHYGEQRPARPTPQR